MVQVHAASPSEWRRHGSVLIPCAGGMTLVAVHGYSLGVMIGPLEREFGWGRAEISGGSMIISFVSLALAPLVGLLVDKVGPRFVAIAGVVAYTVLLTLFSTTGPDIQSWWLRWGLLGLASTMILPTVWTAAINGLFVINRGKALAVALLGTGLAATFIPGITSALISLLGWRNTYIALALGAGGIVLTLVLLFFHGADSSRLRGNGAARIQPLSGMTTREGFHSPAFIKLALGVFIFGVTSLSLTVNAVPVLESRGLTVGAAASVAGLLGVGSIIGRLTGGFLLDRFDANRVAAVAVAAPIIGIALLLLTSGSILAGGAAMLLLGLSLGAEVDACSYLAARHFGMRSFGTLFGTINGIVVFGAGMAPVVANLVYDLVGGYALVLLASVPLCGLASLLFLTLGVYPDFAEPEVEPVPEGIMAGVVA